MFCFRSYGDDEWPQVPSSSLNSTLVLPAISDKTNKEDKITDTSSKSTNKEDNITDASSKFTNKENKITDASSKSRASGKNKSKDIKSVSKMCDSPRNSKGNHSVSLQSSNSSNRASVQMGSSATSEKSQSPKKFFPDSNFKDSRTSNASSEDFHEDETTGSKSGSTNRNFSRSKAKLSDSDFPRSPSIQRNEDTNTFRNVPPKDSPVRSLSRSSNRSNSSGYRYKNESSPSNSKRSSESSAIRFSSPSTSSPQRYPSSRTTSRISKPKTDLPEQTVTTAKNITETNTSAIDSTDFEAEPERIAKSKSPKSSRKYLGNPGSSPRSARRLLPHSVELSESNKGKTQDSPEPSSSKANYRTTGSVSTRPSGGKSRGKNRNRGNKKNGKGKQKKEENSN